MADAFTWRMPGMPWARHWSTTVPGVADSGGRARTWSGRTPPEARRAGSAPRLQPPCTKASASYTQAQDSQAHNRPPMWTVRGRRQGRAPDDGDRETLAAIGARAKSRPGVDARDPQSIVY